MMLMRSSNTAAMGVTGRDETLALTIAGLSFFACAAVFMTTIMVAASMAPGYDLRGDAISDLGVIADTAGLFNVALVLTGALNIVGGIALFSATGRRIDLGLQVLAGLGAIGAGLVPLSAGGLHGIFALAAFVFFNMQIVPMATLAGGAMRWVGYALAAVGVAYVVVMAIGDAGNPAVFGPIGHGGAERMIVYPPMLWLLVAGGHLLGIATVRQ
jgi:hypothetical membrane protein